MAQINFRLDKTEKEVLSFLAKTKNLSVTEFVRSTMFETIAKERVDLAFNLVTEGKIGRKRAWKLSGLSGEEFIREWVARGIKEVTSDNQIQKMNEILDSIDLNQYKKQ